MTDKGKTTTEFESISRLLTVAKARGWTASTTGAELRLFFEKLVAKANAEQNGKCDMCRADIDDWANVSPRLDHVVHMTCREWPRTWLKVKENPIKRIIRKSITAYNVKV